MEKVDAGGRIYKYASTLFFPYFMRFFRCRWTQVDAGGRIFAIFIKKYLFFFYFIKIEIFIFYTFQKQGFYASTFFLKSLF